MTWTWQDDSYGSIVLTGNDLDDLITANSAADTLVSGTGNDTLVGSWYGGGTYLIGAGAGDTTIKANSGGDTLEFGPGITANDITLTSSIVDGNPVVMIQVTGGNTVTIDNPDFISTVIFGDGSTTTLAALSNPSPTSITSSTSIVMPEGATTLTLTGNADISGTGNDLNDTITGNSGSDTLIAGTGLATLVGGSGDDTFVIDNPDDVISALPGTNTEESSVSITAAANVDALTGTGAADLTLTGNDLSDVITANSGNDALVAGTAATTLVGGTGIDSYFVNDSDDVIMDASPKSNENESSVTFAAGVTASMLSVDITANGNLVVGEGTNGGSVTIEGFNPTDPLNSLPVRNFHFSDGSSIGFAELLAQLPESSSGTLANADGTSTSYEIDPAGSDELAIYSSTTVNASGQVVGQFTIGTDGSTNAVSYTYNADGSYVETTVATSATSSTTTTVYDINAQGQITSENVTNPDGSTTAYTFSSAGQLLTDDYSNADTSTNDVTYVYNSDGSYVETAVSTPAGSEGASTTVYDISAQGQITGESVTNPDGSIATYTFDSAGRMLTDDTQNADGSTNDVSNAYKVDGSYVETAVATPRGVGAATTTVYHINAQGQITGENVTSSGSPTTTYTYDSAGRILTDDTVNADGSSNDVTYGYNADGSYVETAVATPAGGGAVTTTVYDVNSQGHISGENVTNPDGSTAAYTYDAAGQVLSDDTQGADGVTNDVSYAYNADGSYEETAVSTPAGGGTPTHTVYDIDGQGQIASEQVTNPNGSTADYTYNATAQVLTDDTQSADGATNDASYQYNSDGSYVETAVSAPSGGVGTTTVYDVNAEGQITGKNVTNPDGSTVAYTYNPAGAVLTDDVTHADGSTNDVSYSYAIDGSYVETAVAASAGGGAATTTVYGLNALGQITGENVTNPVGSTAAYTYDTAGEVLTDDVTHADGSTNDVSYSYASDGSYVEIAVVAAASSSPPTTTVYDINPQGQITAERVTNPDGSTAAYTYNAAGRVLTDDANNADGSTNDVSDTYASDGSYVETEVSAPGSGAATTTMVYGIDAEGQITAETVTHPDGSSAAYSYGTTGQVLTADTQSADGSTNDVTYAYNSDGSYVETAVAAPAGTSASTTTVYDINAQGQITGEQVTSSGHPTTTYTYDSSGQVLTDDTTNADGSTNDVSYGYHGDGSYVETAVATPVGGGADTTTVYDLTSQGHITAEDVTNPDGSTLAYTYSAGGQLLTDDATNSNGVTDVSYSYNSDGSYVETAVATPTGSDASTTTLYDVNAQGKLTGENVTNPDGSTTAYTFNSAGRLLTDDTQSVNGSTNDVSYVYNTDGSYVETAVSTSAGGGAPTTKVYDLSAQGQITSENVTNSDGSTAAYTYNAAGQVLTDDTQSADGATNNVSYSYNADGAYVETSVSTPAGGSAATTTVYDISAQGQITSENVTNPDGSTAAYTYNSSGQVLTDDTVSADGSTNDVSYNYSPDTSYVETSVATPADDSATTTAVYDINAQGQISNENTCTPGTDGSYTDSWSKSDGSSGSYWWNASTSEYLDTWNNSDGIAFTDEYQYAPGGSPTTAGASYTETYTESDGSTGTRQYDSTSNTTMVTWDSSDTGVITSVSTGNSGFIGLLNDGELTNTQNDLTYFNPAVNPTFANFLSAHG